jgi:hypothetical protein
MIRNIQVEEQNIIESMIIEPHLSALNSQDTKCVYEDLKLLEEKINSRNNEGDNDSNKQREWKRFSIDKLELDINM